MTNAQKRLAKTERINTLAGVTVRRLEDMVVEAMPSDTYVRANDEATEKLSLYFASLKKEIEHILHSRRPASTRNKAGEGSTTGIGAEQGSGTEAIATEAGGTHAKVPVGVGAKSVTSTASA